MGFSSPGKKKMEGPWGLPRSAAPFSAEITLQFVFLFSAILYVPPPVADSTQEKVVQ